MKNNFGYTIGLRNLDNGRYQITDAPAQHGKSQRLSSNPSNHWNTKQEKAQHVQLNCPCYQIG